ncbi:fungal-specific transcription factor domain-containing protein [Kalaharituber pfeilii]|nr:fungal-specific transcription factor domain-containing protein [Kalaharituber pfeilii]
MRMDIDIDTRPRPHDGAAISRSIMQDMPQHQKLYPPSTPTGVQPQSHPRNPPTPHLPKAVPTPSSAEPGRTQVHSYEYHPQPPLPQLQQQQQQQQQPSQKQQLAQRQQNITQEKQRGRERDRESEVTDMDVALGNGTGQLSSSTETPSRKRRRSRKGLDKKFECPHPECGRTYSRAEHLYRHQLNHQPKQIYFCDYPECKRTFVRQDLCTRHRERHTNRGSQLQRKDQFLNSAPQNSTRDRKDQPQDSSSPESTLKEEDESQLTSPTTQSSHPTMRNGVSSDISSPGISVPSNDPPAQPKSGDRAKMRRTMGEHGVSRSLSMSLESTPGAGGRRYSLDHVARGKAGSLDEYNRSSPSKADFSRTTIQTSMQTPNMNVLSISSPYSASAPTSAHPFSSHSTTAGFVATTTGTASNNTRQSFVLQAGIASFTLPPQEYSITQTAAPPVGPSSVTSPPTSTSPLDSVGRSSLVGGATMDLEYTPAYAVPVFGGDGFNRSPHTVTDDWATWFFSEEGGSSLGRGSIPASAFIEQPASAQNYYANELTTGGLYHSGINHPMSVTSIIAPPSPPHDSLLTEVKRAELMELINGNNFAIRPMAAYYMGNPVPPEDEDILSLGMMQQYIANYWAHFHPQVPILHKSTFVADKISNYLLLTIMTIGACCIDHRQDPILAAAVGELAKDLAWNLRWCIFSDDEFKPPAKLWVFQALILLETYEKMFSTRPLHERAHIHHATTLTLMRRGQSLTGRPADSPASHRDGTHPGSLNSTTDEWWNKWIQSEATKRAAFAAFVIDSTHATMFGHSATMVAHEIQLTLPCDEGLWAATSANEALRLEQTLTTVGVRPISFLEGLKRTLNGQKVQTNTFGRTVLMAGLLSVSYHMNQRDLQISAVGTAAQFGTKSQWRGSLTRAFDYWKKDFDESLQRAKHTSTTTGTGPFEVDYFLPSTEDVEHESTFESRIVLHHLAHMAMHVDIIDLQIYAGASRLLGKAIGPSDYNAAQRRMKDWAPTARARDATFYALRFLSHVLLPEERAGIPLDEDESAAMGPTRKLSNATTTTGVPLYSARDDHLLNRPWVLYFAMLIVWSYGYALDGPLTNPQIPQTQLECYTDMRNFLRRVGGVREPGELAHLRGRNACLGLLATLRDMFMLTRWELMGEAAKLLQTGYDILVGRT